MVTESVLIQAVIGTVLGGKKGSDAFKQASAPLKVKTVPFEPEMGQNEGTGDGKS